jgi:hypothetical protein
MLLIRQPSVIPPDLEPARPVWICDRCAVDRFLLRRRIANIPTQLDRPRLQATITSHASSCSQLSQDKGLGAVPAKPETTCPFVDHLEFPLSEIPALAHRVPGQPPTFYLPFPWDSPSI